MQEWLIGDTYQTQSRHMQEGSMSQGNHKHTRQYLLLVMGLGTYLPYGGTLWETMVA